MGKKKSKSKKRKSNTPRKVVRTRGGAHVGKALDRERSTVQRLRRELAAAKNKKRNPKRPPHAWWTRCLSSVEAQRYARDPAAVCSAAWWKLPAKRRAAILSRYERGTPRERRKAVALAKAERNRVSYGGPVRRAVGGSRRPNPPRELVSLVYLEQKPGDGEAYEYEHEFSGRRPRLSMRGHKLRIEGGTYTTKDGWIRG
jgi:hypothetical protein